MRLLPEPMPSNPSVRFFDEQFRRQVSTADYTLNPFEVEALPYLGGDVLDYGCGLGNLAIEAARRGCSVTALDASPAAIARIRSVALEERLQLTAEEADLREHEIAGQYDAVVSIGLLMFFDCPTARRKLLELQAHVRPGGVAVVNVLTEGTDFLDMFSPEGHCLFKPGELVDQFGGWVVVTHKAETFPAPRGLKKVFETLIARKPRGE